MNSQFTFRGTAARIAAKLLFADSGRKRFSQCLDGDEGAISRAFGILTGVMGNLQGWLDLHAVIGKATPALIGPLTASLAGRDKLLTPALGLSAVPLDGGDVSTLFLVVAFSLECATLMFGALLLSRRPLTTRAAVAPPPCGLPSPWRP